MNPLPNLVGFCAQIAEPYLTLLEVHPTHTYNYVKRGFTGLPVIEVKQHRPKCGRGESWLYVAVPAGTALKSLGVADRLYVGAQTQDRMFRGEGLGGTNFHHAEMRAGNGLDTPMALLQAGRQIDIYRINANQIASLISLDPDLHALKVLLAQLRTSTKHLGWWFEQYILFAEAGSWRWNTAREHSSLPGLFGCQAVHG